jgi:acyl carrier protein
MNQNALAQVIKIVSEITKEPNISLSSTQENTIGWDSLAYLVIAQELEDVFGVQITAENIDLASSVTGIVKLISNLEGEIHV